MRAALTSRALLATIFISCAVQPAPTPKEPTRARLLLRAVLSAKSFVDGPPSGAFLDAKFHGPFSSQPAQGFSALQLDGERFWSISDNGYGAPENSSDFLLRIWNLTPDFSAGTLRATPQLTLSDPQRHLSWPIRNHFTPQRLLTGADLDPESLVRAPDGTLWVGDEQGPFLVHLDALGQVMEPPFPLTLDGGPITGPDSPFLRENLMLRSLEALRAHAVAHGAKAPVASPDHHWLASAAHVKALQVAGFRVVPWTVNEPARLAELLVWNVDGVITDRPDLAQAYLDAGKDLQGHRGARGLAPENTPAAFAAGLAQHVPTLELDLTATADDAPVVWHDATLPKTKCPRVADAGVLIPASRLRDLTSVECDGLRPEFPTQLRVDGGSYRVMTLSDALRLPGRLNLETKVHGTGLAHDSPEWLTRAVIHQVAGADAGSRVTLQSFDWRSLVLAHEAAPWLQTVALFGDSPADQPDSTRAGLPWPARGTRPDTTRSAGFENLALTVDGKSLIAMLEKPLPGQTDCLAFRFDLTSRRWAGVAFRYPLDGRATAVGDLTFIDERHGYALERDDSEHRDDGFKRLVRFTLPEVAGAQVVKATAADLLDLELPDAGTFTFPFWTIEGVAVLPDGRVAIINDNNFPMGRGRSETEPDETELIIVAPR